MLSANCGASRGWGSEGGYSQGLLSTKHSTNICVNWDIHKTSTIAKKTLPCAAGGIIVHSLCSNIIIYNIILCIQDHTMFPMR